MAVDAPIQRHWPVPISLHRLEGAGEINPVLARVFQAMRVTDPAAGAPGAQGGFYASADDLLQRVDVPEFGALLRFIAASLQATAQQANAGVWPEARHGLQLELVGVWFQIQNGAAFHDVHTHGNCSWSGVYCVQVDPPQQRAAHPLFGVYNGATRFYSPMFPLLGGAYIDMGNAWLQNATLDFSLQEGDLVLFPSLLAHKAMPYAGARDRIIVSSNAQIRAPGGDRLFRYTGT